MERDKIKIAGKEVDADLAEQYIEFVRKTNPEKLVIRPPKQEKKNDPDRR